MKKNAFFTMTGVVLLLFTISSFRIPAGPSMPVQGSMPDTIAAIVKKSCVPCHSTNGNGMAKGVINFDNWDKYPADKKASKAEDICKEVKKGAMPPAGFRKKSPDQCPTEHEIQMLCDWTATIKKP